MSSVNVWHRGRQRRRRHTFRARAASTSALWLLDELQLVPESSASLCDALHLTLGAIACCCRRSRKARHEHLYSSQCRISQAQVFICCKGRGNQERAQCAMVMRWDDTGTRGDMTHTRLTTGQDWRMRLTGLKSISLCSRAE